MAKMLFGIIPVIFYTNCIRQNFSWSRMQTAPKRKVTITRLEM